MPTDAWTPATAGAEPLRFFAGVIEHESGSAAEGVPELDARHADGRVESVRSLAGERR